MSGEPPWRDPGNELAPSQRVYEPGQGGVLRDPGGRNLEPPYQPHASEDLFVYDRTPNAVRSRGRRIARSEVRPPAASTPSPFAQPDLWDALGIAGVLFLGIVKVSGEPIGVDLDVRKHAGADGGTIRDKGFKLAKVKITLRIWDEETWVSFDGLLPAIDPRRQAGRRTPVDIDHPSLAQRGVWKVYVESIGLPDVKDDGSVEVAINALEFHPPSGANVARTARASASPDIGANRTAFTGLEQAPPSATPPSTTGAASP